MDLQFDFFVLYFASQTKYAPLAQLDRAFVYGTKGQGFESLATHQKQKHEQLLFVFFYVINTIFLTLLHHLTILMKLNLF